MPIEELTSDSLVQRCAHCSAQNTIPLTGLSVGMGGLGKDDVDPAIIRVPACRGCRAEEFLVRSSDDEPDHPLPGSYGHRHRLLVDHLHGILADAARVHPHVDARSVRRVARAELEPWFGESLTLTAPLAVAAIQQETAHG
jgi:hypothetical protein